MNDTLIRAQYSTGLSRRNIEQALIAAGKDLDHLQPSDLALLDSTGWQLSRLRTAIRGLRGPSRP
jgi:hypothetical protein